MTDKPKQCAHERLHFNVNNACMGDTNLHYLEISAKCLDCEIDMVFRGLPLGMSPHHPTSSIDGREAVLPFLAEGEPMTGKPMGFSVETAPHLKMKVVRNDG